MATAMQGPSSHDEHQQLAPHHNPEKKRKINHNDRKDILNDKIRLLESGVAVLKTRGLSPTLMLQKDSVLLPAVEEHAGLLYAIQVQQLRVAKMQSALSQCQPEQRYYPLYSHIRLTRDWNERRATLLAMRKQKLLRAVEFLMTPPRVSDPNETRFSENKFETAEGDLCCVRFETVQLAGVESLQQVFDALSFYTTNMEIISSEQLGHITLRDDYDTVEDKAFHSRFLTTNLSGVTVEYNIISFRQMMHNGYEGKPCGVIIVDNVDEDDLFPYIPSERVRRDASGAIVLTASRRCSTCPNPPSELSDAEDNSDDELIVTMRRAAFLKLHRPHFQISALQLQELQDNAMKWADVMLKSVRGMVYSPR
ncbi:hypothetical protein PHYBOEH_009237 [Phytophthora boehmeriae]|uniref:Uncharacterized protein n=1 Tax=Phytophthora boehmeriae TaxID=109152 RepID=A0A8T1X173_9STRA|nr:hypothetical protein PHYBOEH_009237 [Phytophthora boehmeriae]